MNSGRKLSTCFILFAMVVQSVTWRHSSILPAQQLRAGLTTTLTPSGSGHSRISRLNRQRETKKILMLILSNTFLFARHHYHPTGTAKLFPANWSKTPLLLSPAIWVSGHMLKTDPAFNTSSSNSPRSCTPHNFEILPERNTTVEELLSIINYCTVINFFYRKGQQAREQN